ncbi:hypothetical protein [Devosia sp. 63-57]|uniref:hypothetical protein n=1 Tax=Devosia sp. 63-57 TaxID=1895751 RepID=UPI0008695BDE|nr:hypothetical protein [Devosia sp. 63-57]ODT47695.1 MAG: hypothetical protein ABS74_15770 [Pelagibacterium sp. SCN 63-126]ODU88249.1 MAG: hypothetical protein ABT14_03375 [Pelagibacterium sp. SCN 63-17]OJX42597.1 MAG: hypothetical protein BGO80_14090 [Devosia sp. 63-57]
MAQPSQTFFDEATNAVRGCWALITGKRNASAWFDFSQRGLVGSFVAVLIAMLLAGFGPMLLGIPVRAGAPTQSIIVNAILFAAQAGMAWIVLRQMGRQDGFVPYLVATNWVTLVSGVLLLISLFFGELGLIVLLAVVIVAILTFVNIGRFIVTLSAIQIGLLFVSQAVGVFLALGIVAIFLPVPTV